MVNYKEKSDEAMHVTHHPGVEQTRAEWL
ncbi:peptide chain release factor N(5)-glutamine methyltransferase, partial [Staphylococcus aureus]|nr:peptide chain release factor N(5)-glutamine methyltransferase [Staphylococcus aureus]